MRKLLSPYFIGREEPGLDNYTGPLDEALGALPGNYKPGTTLSINFINNGISDFVTRTLAVNTKPVVLSGDCLSAIGCLAGAQKKSSNVFLLWFDAHGDFHTPQTTISGHLGGMPLAMISGRGAQDLTTAVNLLPLPDSQIFFVGGRDLEEGEKQALQASGIRQSARATNLLSIMPADAQYWLHYDTDYLNPAFAPAMRYPAPQGVTAGEARSDLQLLADSFNILGVSVSAWAPHLDQDGLTASTCWNTLQPLFKN